MEPTDRPLKVVLASVPFAGASADTGGDELATTAGVRRMFARIADAIAAAGDSIAAVSRYTDHQQAEIGRLHEELAELRDEVLAIANRVEATNRVLASRTEHLA